MVVLDFSRGRLTATQVRAANCAGVVRYVGTPGNPKNLTRAEYDDLTTGSHGAVVPVGVAVVHEAGTSDILGGYAAGVAAARASVADLDAIGFPRTKRPVYFTADRDLVTEADFRAAMEFLRGAGSVLGGPQLVGVYGEFDVIQRARKADVARWFWQTVAWSGGKRDPGAHLFQRLGQVVVAGVTCDLNDQLQADFGQHPYQEEDLLSALTDQQQLDMHNRIMGFLRQRWYVIRDGQPVEVSADTPDAIPAHALDSLDGNYLVGRADRAAALAQVRPAAGVDVHELAAELAPVLAPMIPADATPDEFAAAVLAALRAHPLTPAGGA